MKTKSEALIQQECVLWFNNNFCLKHHVPRCSIFSVPNETQSYMELRAKKATGLRSGVSDLIVLLPNKCLFVEVKTLVGKQSKNQIEFQETVEMLGFEYHLVRSLSHFKFIIK